MTVAADKVGTSMPNRKIVYVVDDDHSVLESVQGLLRSYGYRTAIFPSAQAFEDHTNFDKALCIVLDINLNDGISGIDLRHRLKAAGNSVPVIYMTANDNHAVRMAALESGCLAYLTKPFSAESLIEPLERASGLA